MLDLATIWGDIKSTDNEAFDVTSWALGSYKSPANLKRVFSIKSGGWESGESEGAISYQGDCSNPTTSIKSRGGYVLDTMYFKSFFNLIGMHNIVLILPYFTVKAKVHLIFKDFIH